MAYYYCCRCPSVHQAVVAIVVRVLADLTTSMFMGGLLRRRLAWTPPHAAGTSASVRRKQRWMCSDVFVGLWIILAGWMFAGQVAHAALPKVAADADQPGEERFLRMFTHTHIVS